MGDTRRQDWFLVRRLGKGEFLTKAVSVTAYLHTMEASRTTTAELVHVYTPANWECQTTLDQAGLYESGLPLEVGGRASRHDLNAHQVYLDLCEAVLSGPQIKRS